MGQLDKRTQQQDVACLLEEFGQIESINVSELIKQINPMFQWHFLPRSWKIQIFLPVFCFILFKFLLSFIINSSSFVKLIKCIRLFCWHFSSPNICQMLYLLMRAPWYNINIESRVSQINGNDNLFCFLFLPHPHWPSLVQMIPPRGCAYIVMIHRQDAFRALQKLSRGSHKVNQKAIKVSEQ